jgi:predicted secreted protein
VQGRQVTVSVEAIDAEGKFIQFANIEGQVIAPDVSTNQLELTQTGPGQYQGRFQAAASGSYVVNLRYKKLADDTTHFSQTTVTIPFAPEFRDLTDNAPLLAEVSDISGGRILGSDPNQADLFDYAGLKFPETELPLLRPLMLIWLALFLLDVAARRVIIDIRAIARRAASFVRLKKLEQKTDQTLERLRARRQTLRDQLSARKAGQSASRRYQASEDYRGEMPTAETVKRAEANVEKKAEKPVPKKAEATEDTSHIDRLLKAKHKAAEHRQDDKTENNEQIPGR